MADYGMRVSYTGKEVTSCSDLDTVLTSKYATLKGSKKGSGSSTVSNSATVTTITIAHGLGYTPFVTGLADVWNNGDYLQTMPWGGLYGNGYTQLYVLDAYIEADATNVYIRLRYLTLLGTPPAASYTFYYNYYIYLDKGDLN